MTVQIFPIRSPKIIEFNESVLENLTKAIDISEIQLQDGDIIAITSKVVSMEQKAAVWLDDVQPTDEANQIAKSADMDSRVAQLIIDESIEIIGQVWHAVLARTKYGLSANAGIDLSNCPDGYALLLPRNPDKVAAEYRRFIMKHYNVKVAVIITDSRTIPLKRGTTAVAIGLAGMDPVIDERGSKDLYGYTMTISTRGVADNAANCANVVMGETNEQTPFALIRGMAYEQSETKTLQDALMPADQCLYFAPILELLKK